MSNENFNPFQPPSEFSKTEEGKKLESRVMKEGYTGFNPQTLTDPNYPLDVPQTELTLDELMATVKEQVLNNDEIPFLEDNDE